MKKLIYLWLLCITTKSMAQVGAVSGGKLNAAASVPVDYKHVEFEPSFALSRWSKAWDNNSKLQNIYNSDSSEIASEFDARFTYGVLEGVEIGASMPVDMSGMSMGIKYQIYNNDKTNMGAMFGTNMPLGNRLITKQKTSIDEMTSVAGGIIFGMIFSEKASWDNNVQYQMYTGNYTGEKPSDLFFTSDFGYYLTEEFQVIGSLNYAQSSFKTSENNSQLLSMSLGTTIETMKNVILVFNVPIDLYGKNIEKTLGFSFALTTTIE